MRIIAHLPLRAAAQHQLPQSRFGPVPLGRAWTLQEGLGRDAGPGAVSQAMSVLSVFALGVYLPHS